MLLSLAVVTLLAVTAPVAVRAIPATAVVPVVVVEILLGVIAGPQGRGWFQLDGTVEALALLGAAFLFFLAGLEVDLHGLRGRVLGVSFATYASGLVLAALCAEALHRVGLLESPLLIAVAFSATGLGLVIPILRDVHLARSPRGAMVIAMASIAEFSSVILLAVGFSAGSGPAAEALLLVGLAVAAVVVTITGERIRRNPAVSLLVDRLSGGTIQLRVRLSVALVVCFAALAEAGGLEVVLGAFFAGGILNVVDGDAMSSPALRNRLDGIGYGLLIPVFFIVSGARLSFSAITIWPGALLLVPALVLTLLVARTAPAVVACHPPRDRGALGVGLLCATSLPVIVTAAQIGLQTGRIDASTAAAITVAGLAGVCVFPAIAIRLLRGGEPHPVDPMRQLGT